MGRGGKGKETEEKALKAEGERRCSELVPKDSQDAYTDGCWSRDGGKEAET